MHGVKKRGDVAVVTVDPALSRGEQEELDALKELCTQLQNEGYTHIVLDMAGVDHAPSLVLGSIIVLQKRMNTRQGGLAILRPTDRLKRILEITKMDRIVRIYTDEDEAVEALVGRS